MKEEKELKGKGEIRSQRCCSKVIEATSCSRGTAQLQLHFEARRVSVERPEIALQAEGVGRKGGSLVLGGRKKGSPSPTVNIMSKVSWSTEGNKGLKEQGTSMLTEVI